MPKRDPDTPRIDLYSDAFLYVENSKWHIKLNLPKGSKPRQPVRSTGVAYDPNNDFSQTDAIRRATTIYTELKTKAAAGQPLSNFPVERIVRLYLKECEDGYLANKKSIDAGYEPQEKIIEGRGHWDIENIQKTRNAIERFISPFWEQKKYKTLHVSEINSKHIQEWIDWKQIQYGEGGRAPTTVRTHHTVMRHCFKYARRQGYINALPHIPDPKFEMAKRRRPEMTDEQWDELRRYVFAKWNGKDDLQAHYSFLFSQWLLYLEHTGVRPFKSVKKAPMWRHIRREGDKTLIWRDEKNKGRWAAADPWFNKVLIRLETWQKHHNVYDPENGYLFVHPESIVDWKGEILREKGKPIANFQKAWRVAMRELGWNDGKTKATERIVPYSIRHRYATRRIYNKEITIYELAQQMGNSVAMIETIYAHANATRNWETFMANELEEQHRVDFTDKHTGMLAGSFIEGSPEYEAALQNTDYVKA